MDLRTEIVIDAPAGAIWAVLTDTARYHEWNPFITTLEGRLVVGEQLNLVVSPPDGSDFRFRPTVRRCDEAVELRWKGRVLSDALFCGEHFFKLTEQPGGSTRFLHGEDFRGYLLRFLGHQLTRTARGFVFMNQALKRRVERG